MPRQVRVEYAGAHYHVLARGNNRQAIFLSDEDRKRFLQLVEEAVQQTGWVVHSYVLMRNHYHLLLETPEPNLVAGMKWFQQTYTQRFNVRHGRSGHLYQGRYKAIPIEEEDQGSVNRVSTYIHLNPFRARVCGVGCGRGLESYVWSSYPEYLRSKRYRHPWLEVERALGHLNLSGSKSKDRQRYRAMMEEQMAYEADSAHRKEVNVAHKEFRRGWYVGSEEFRDWLLERFEGRGDNLRGVQRRDHGEAEAERLLRGGLAVLGSTLREVREWKAVDPRKQALAWLIKTHTTVTVVWIAERLAMGHRCNASRGISRFHQGTSREVRGLRRKMSQGTG